VPFRECDKVDGEPEPIKWHKPFRGFSKGTTCIYPGEVVSGERLFSCRPDANAIQVALQVKLVSRRQSKSDAEPKNLNEINASHTTMCIVTRPPSEPRAWWRRCTR
jgi:hypothetical protein